MPVWEQTSSIGPRRAEQNAARRERNKAAIRQAKEGACADCGGIFPFYVMDLDHRPGEDKLFDLSGSYSRSCGAVRAEIAKCDRVCANCHRIRTHLRDGKYGYATGS